MKRKAEVGAILPQARDCRNQRDLEEARKDPPPPTAFGESVALLAPDMGHRHPEL